MAGEKSEYKPLKMWPIPASFKRSALWWGDLVWGRVKGYPYWPGRIDCVRLSRCFRRNQPDHPVDENTMWPVFFYGTHERMWIPQRDIQPYAVNREKHQEGAKSKAFLGALKELVQNPNGEFPFTSDDKEGLIPWLLGEQEIEWGPWDDLAEERKKEELIRVQKRIEAKKEEEKELDESFEADPLIKSFKDATHKIEEMEVGDMIGANYDRPFYGIIKDKSEADGIFVQYYTRKKTSTNTYIIKKKDTDWVDERRQGYIFFYAKKEDVEIVFEGKTEAFALLKHNNDDVDLEWQRWCIHKMAMHGEDTTAAEKELETKLHRNEGRKRRQTLGKTERTEDAPTPVKRRKQSSDSRRSKASSKSSSRASSRRSSRAASPTPVTTKFQEIETPSVETHSNGVNEEEEVFAERTTETASGLASDEAEIVDNPAQEEAIEEHAKEKSPENSTKGVIDEPVKEETKNSLEETEDVPTVESQADGENKEEEPEEKDLQSEPENEKTASEKEAHANTVSQDGQTAEDEDGSLNGSMDLFSSEDVKQEPTPADEPISSTDQPRAVLSFDQSENEPMDAAYDVDITNKDHPLFLSSDSQSSQGSQDSQSSIPSLEDVPADFP